MEKLQSMWPLFGCGVLMLALHAARVMSVGSSNAALLQWGAFQKQRVRSKQWWRIISYAFVYRSWFHLVSDVAAIVLFGLAITQLTSFSLAFATFRLGLFVALLSFFFTAQDDQVIVSTSGSAYCMVGALVVVGARNWQQWLPLAPGTSAMLIALAVTALALFVRPWLIPDGARAARSYALLAGGGAAIIELIVSLLTR